MFNAILFLILAFGAVGVMVLAIRFAVADAENRDPHTEAIVVFVACFLLLLGLRIMFLGGSGDGLFLGDLLASLALTFFWMMRRKARDRMNGQKAD